MSEIYDSDVELVKLYGSNSVKESEARVTLARATIWFWPQEDFKAKEYNLFDFRITRIEVGGQDEMVIKMMADSSGTTDEVVIRIGAHAAGRLAEMIQAESPKIAESHDRIRRKKQQEAQRRKQRKLTNNPPGSATPKSSS